MNVTNLIMGVGFIIAIMGFLYILLNDTDQDKDEPKFNLTIEYFIAKGLIIAGISIMIIMAIANYIYMYISHTNDTL